MEWLDSLAWWQLGIAAAAVLALCWWADGRAV
jgi:hypothetical protein